MSSFPCSDKAVKNEKRDLWSRHAKLSACQIRDYLSKGKGKVAHEPQEAHTAGAYPSFCSLRQLRVLLLPPGWDASPSQGYPPAVFCQYPFYTGNSTMAGTGPRTTDPQIWSRRANHYTTAPPPWLSKMCMKCQGVMVFPNELRMKGHSTSWYL